MIYSAGDLGVEIDLGANEPGAVLQRKESGGWQDYCAASDQVRGPVDVHERSILRQGITVLGQMQP